MNRLALLLMLFVACSVHAADPYVSGLQNGQRPGPYSFLVATGPQRGQQTCYICETAERPAAIVFTRSLSDPLAKLLVQFDAFVTAQPKDSVRSWMTVLGEKTIGLDDLSKWGKEVGLRNVPVGVFDDPVGPPSYRIKDDADVTVLLFVDRKVVANFSYKKGEFNDEAVKKISDTLPKLLEKKK